MPRAYFSLGSNIDPERNLKLGIDELRRNFGKLELSAVYRSPPAGFEGDDFLNLAACCSTGLLPREIQSVIEGIHRLAGRRRGEQKFSSRTLDIDLLLYDDAVIDEPGLHLPRADILDYSFVLCPLAELAPNLLHPLTGRSLAEHWQEFAVTAQPLTRVPDLC